MIDLENEVNIKLVVWNEGYNFAVVSFPKFGNGSPEIESQGDHLSALFSGFEKSWCSSLLQVISL